MLLSLFLPFLPSACTPRPPSLRLRRWQLVRLPRRGRQRRLGSSVEQGTSNNSSCCSGLPRQLQQPQLQQHPVKDSNPRKPETNEEIAVQVPECLTNSLALFLIHLKLQRAVQNTLSQTEILALCLLARERRQRLPPSTPTATKAKPIADKVAHSSAEGQAPCFANGGTPCFTGGRYPCSADGCSGSPSQQCRGPTCASLPSAFATAVGGRRFRIDPLDVCVLLASQRLQLDDLSLLDDLESVAAETEAAHEKENKWWRWATMLGINRKRGDIWKSAAAKLQQQQQKQEQQQHHRLVRRRRKKSLVAEESLPPFPVLATSPCSAAAANNKNNNIKKTALGAPAVTLSASAAAESGFAPLRGPGSMQLGLCPDAAATAGAPEAPGRFPTGASLEALSPASRHWGDCTSLRGPGAPSFHPFRSDEAGAEAPASAVGEPAAAGGNEAAAAAAGEAAAAAVARLSRNCLALLGHSCQWPLAASCTGGPRALVSDPVGGSPRASQGPPSLGEDWKSAVGFREGRRGSSSRRRVTLRRRQRLSPLDPPYDAHALLLHPFCAAPAAALPDAETARAAEVHEVALDFLSRTKGTQGCPQCIRGEPRKGDKQNPTNASPCPHHQRLHYTKVGTGPEKVILIHGICMSGYFFADVIRALFPHAGSRGEPRRGPLRGPLRGAPQEVDAHERWRYTFYCVDLLGYGKSAAIPSTQNYSRREQTVAHPYFGELLLRLGVVLRPIFEPLVLRLVPPGELPQLSVADIFSIHPDALTGTIRSIVQDRIDMTLQLLRQRGQRASLFHGTADGVIPIRQARFLALRYPNIHLRALAGFVHHFPASHAQFTAHIILQEIGRSLRNGRGLCYSHDEDPSNTLILAHNLLLPGHPTW